MKLYNDIIKINEIVRLNWSGDYEAITKQVWHTVGDLEDINSNRSKLLDSPMHDDLTFAKNLPVLAALVKLNAKIPYEVQLASLLSLRDKHPMDVVKLHINFFFGKHLADIFLYDRELLPLPNTEGIEQATKSHVKTYHTKFPTTTSREFNVLTDETKRMLTQVWIYKPQEFNSYNVLNPIDFDAPAIKNPFISGFSSIGELYSDKKSSTTLTHGTFLDTAILRTKGNAKPTRKINKYPSRRYY